MERKLATVLFVDIVDSTRLVTGTDPEVVRRRVNEFFETVSDSGIESMRSSPESVGKKPFSRRELFCFSFSLREKVAT